MVQSEEMKYSCKGHFSSSSRLKSEFLGNKTHIKQMWTYHEKDKFYQRNATVFWTPATIAEVRDIFISEVDNIVSPVR